MGRRKKTPTYSLKRKLQLKAARSKRCCKAGGNSHSINYLLLQVFSCMFIWGINITPGVSVQAGYQETGEEQISMQKNEIIKSINE